MAAKRRAPGAAPVRTRVPITRSVGAATVERLAELARRRAAEAGELGIEENPRRLEGRLIDELVARAWREAGG